jgi:phosphohistidine phosphatase
MDLILWRHAEAEDEAPQGDDLRRPLTARGEKQAARVAAWLDRNLAEGVRIFSSPALRCEQTLQPLGRRYKVREDLAPGASVESLLEAANWPDAKHAVLLVGHQPTLGDVAARLLGTDQAVSVRKGAVWWFRSRDRGTGGETVLVAVIAPDLL